MKTFFLGMESELVIVKETSDGYSSSSHLKGKRPNRLAFDPQNKERIYCATNNDGLWRSENGGEDWERIGQGVFSENKLGASSRVTAVAVNPVRRVDGNSIVYAGTEPSMLFYSTDNGETWKEFKGIQALPSKNRWSFPPRPETHYVRWITPSFSNEDFIGVSIEAGAVFTTEDHGENWKDRAENSPIDAHTLLMHPKAPGRLYAACGDGVSNSKYAYAESDDEGQTWKYKSEGVENHPYLYHMALNPENPDDILVSAQKGPSQAHSYQLYSTIYRKIGGELWKEIGGGLPKEHSYSHNLEADPIERNVFYALNNNGLYRLNIDESHWEKLEIDWKEDYLNQQPPCFAVKEYR